jgi:hypothetical protein
VPLRACQFAVFALDLQCRFEKCVPLCAALAHTFDNSWIELKITPKTRTSLLHQVSYCRLKEVRPKEPEENDPESGLAVRSGSEFRANTHLNNN